MRIVWTPRANRQRDVIFDYIASENLNAAFRMDELFKKSASTLRDHPKIGKAGKMPGTRELIAHRNYRIIYEIDDDDIYILSLIHIARQWPPFNQG